MRRFILIADSKFNGAVWIATHLLSKSIEMGPNEKMMDYASRIATQDHFVAALKHDPLNEFAIMIVDPINRTPTFIKNIQFDDIINLMDERSELNIAANRKLGRDINKDRFSLDNTTRYSLDYMEFHQMKPFWEE